MYCVSDKFVALSLCVLCFEESVLCCQCECVVFCTYEPPYESHNKFSRSKEKHMNAFSLATE